MSKRKFAGVVYTPLPDTDPTGLHFGDEWVFDELEPYIPSNSAPSAEEGSRIMGDEAAVTPIARHDPTEGLTDEGTIPCLTVEDYAAAEIRELRLTLEALNRRKRFGVDTELMDQDISTIKNRLQELGSVVVEPSIPAQRLGSEQSKSLL